MNIGCVSMDKNNEGNVAQRKNQILLARNSLTKSAVVNTSINDCCLKCGSFDQIAMFDEKSDKDNANARYGESFGSGKFLIDSTRNASYADFLKKVIKLSSSICLISNSCSERFDFSRQSSLYLFNSSFMNSGAINSEVIESNRYVEIDSGLKSENRMLLSNTSFILVYLNSSLFSGDIELSNSSLFSGDSSESNLLNESFFAFLPKSTDHLINSCSSLEFNLDNNNFACFLRSINFSLTSSDQLIQRNFAISDFNSGLNANVIDAIYISPLFLSFSSAESSLILSDITRLAISATLTSGNCSLNSANSSSETDIVIFGILINSSNYFNTSNYVYKSFGLGIGVLDNLVGIMETAGVVQGSRYVVNQAGLGVDGEGNMIIGNTLIGVGVFGKVLQDNVVGLDVGWLSLQEVVL